MNDRYKALRYSDRDMHPRVMENEVVIFDIESPIQDGDDVVIDLRNGSTIVRTLVGFDDTLLRLKTYKPAAASTLTRDKVKACYPIIGRMKSRDFDALAKSAEPKCEPS